MADEGFATYVLEDLFGHIPGITSKKMFGGHGFYQDGAIFAIIAYDELYFKTDESLEPEFEKYGSEPFVYDGHKDKGPTKMPYWKLPTEIMEDSEQLEEWIYRSADVTRSKKK